MALQDLIAYLVLSAGETFIFHMFFRALLRRNESRGVVYAGGMVVYYAFQFVSYALQCPLFSTAPLYAAFALSAAFLFYHGSNQVRGAAALAFAIIILTIANIMCIFAGALLNRLGEAFPKLTGDRKTLIRNAEEAMKDDEKISYSIADLGGALLVALGSYVFGQLCSRVLLPTIAGAAIHQFAYMILFVVVLAATGVIPKNICAAAKRLQSFMTGACSIVIMVGMGVDFNLMELVQATSVQNVVVALMVVVGAILGSAAVGYLVGFYPIDSAVTAGLCMANRGGNGDLAVLGASHRMGLMAYAQLSSRLGGGIVLLIASFMFSYLLV